MLTPFKIFFLKLISPIVVAALAYSGLAVVKNTSIPKEAPTPVLGAFNPTGGANYRLQSSIGISDTTINLTSFKEPVSNTPYTMSYISSSVAYATLDPQTLTRSEFISFTGITQNVDGTAQLTGVTRGLSRTPGTGGCVASSTLAQSHSGQSLLILSNSPCFYSEFAVLKNNETITGDWLAPAPANSTSVANRAYVDGKVFSGIGGASETATGTVEIATNTEVASSTTNGSLGRLVIPSSQSTSTYNYATAPLRAVVTDNNGLIDSLFTRMGATSTANENITALDAVAFPDFVDTVVASTTKGSSQYFSVADTAPLSVTGNLTIETWVKPLSLAQANGILGKHNGGPTIAYSLEARGDCTGTVTQQCLIFRLSSDGTNTVTPPLSLALPLRTWTHLAVVFNATSTATSSSPTIPQTVTFYVNGDLASSTAVSVSSIADTSAELEIGRIQSDSTNSWNGQLSDVRIWNVARTSKQIKENYNRRLNGNEPGLAGYWKLNGTLNDSTANAATLTNNGSATFPIDTNTGGAGSLSIDKLIEPINISTTTVVRANASVATTSRRFIGFAERSVSAGQQVKVFTSGFVNGFTSLNAGSIYYLGDTAGAINPYPSQYYSQRVGIALSTTTLLIAR